MREKMKKIGLISIITIVTILFLGAISSVQAYASNTVYDADGKLRTLSTGDELTLIYYNSGGYKSIQHQLNVYCAEVTHKAPVGVRKKYRVGPEKKVEDPALAYILAHGPNGSIPTTGSGRLNSAQIALWYYLHVKQPSQYHDKDNIGGSYGSNKNTYSNSLYKAAINYRQNISNATPKVSCATKDTGLKIDVSGSCTKYKLYIDGSLYGTYSKGEKETKSITIAYNDAAINGKSEVSVKVVPVHSCITATYRILTAVGNSHQKFLVATGTGTEDRDGASVTQKVKLNTNVSLQKYITRVISPADGTSDISGRKNNYTATDETSEYAKRHPSKNNTSSNQYKKNKVVEIEAGDEVTYTIEVYNNGEVPAFKYTVRDLIPLESQVTSLKNSSGGNVEYKNLGTGPDARGYTIEFDVPQGLAIGETKTFTMTLKYTKYSDGIKTNTAWIHTTTPPNKTTYRTLDRDYIKMKPYAVKLEKYISRVNNVTRDAENTTLNRSGKPEHADDNDTKTNNPWKANNVVVVSKGDEVTYTITVTNEHKETSVYITNIKDTLPTGISQYKVGNGGWNTRPSNGMINITDTSRTLLAPGRSTSVTVTVKVTESNLSLDVFKNEAEITEMKNRNQVTVTDTTLNNNKDADYFELRDITIQGKVWNDVARNKTNDDYNGKYESDKKEKLLEGITVYLYRVTNVVNPETSGKNYRASSAYQSIDKVATTQTNNKGEYTFSRSNLNSNLPDNTRYIKGPRNTPTNNRWSGTYYSYYVVFEYDGIKYTCSLNKTSQQPEYFEINTSLPGDYRIDSNAAEDNNANVSGLGITTRKAFNSKFTTIDNTKGINYNKLNEDGFIPASEYIYNKNTMSIKSSTNKIDLASAKGDATKMNNLEEQMLNVGLGLRGRDLFDLHLSSAVAYTDISVHSQNTRYEHNPEEKANVTFKPEDLGIVEDMANVAREKTINSNDVNADGSKKEDQAGYGVTQNMRRGDYNEEYANRNDIGGQTRHNSQAANLQVSVTYRLTITNESQTDGYAAQVMDYYDDRFDFVKASASVDGPALTVNTSQTGGDGYKAVLITMPKTYLGQSKEAHVYVTLKMKDPKSTLQPLVDNPSEKVRSYNMAEIWQYTTKASSSQTEYTRGLLDKDSAPGTANTEKANLNEGTTNQTTAGYYFKRSGWKAANDLTKLKYEDDTYAAPTLYFVDTTALREITGVIYRDGTSVSNNTYIKSGNGTKEDNEKGVEGAYVELVELDDKTNKQTPGKVGSGEGKLILSTYTGEGGTYSFKRFMPANYIIRYTYGNERGTVVAQHFEANTNEDSFNGEDYQSTNNTGKNGGKLLADTDKDYWYVSNASNKVSTGTDNVERRKGVAKKVTGYTDSEMRTLQKARNTKDNRSITLSDSEVEKIAHDTHMYSTTPNFTVAVEMPTGVATKNTKFTTTYVVQEMNLGLAETPKTEITLNKKITGFTIKDATGENVLASWDTASSKSAGDVLKLNENDGYDVSIEDTKLQGAKLEVNFQVSTNAKVERNFDTTENPVQPITAVADFIDNDLSFNPSLLAGDGSTNTNGDYWEVIPYQNDGTTQGLQSFLKDKVDATREYAGVDENDTRYGNGGYGSLDESGVGYTTILKAKANNPILHPTQTATGYTSKANITLEKTLSAEETTVRDIITSSINTYEYDNHVEVIGLDYTNTKTGATGNSFNFMDRIIRNPADNAPDYEDPLFATGDNTEYVMLAGVQHDYVASDRITIHPPTGGDRSNDYYYLIAGALAIIAAGVVAVKKFALKEEAIPVQDTSDEE